MEAMYQLKQMVEDLCYLYDHKKDVSGSIHELKAFYDTDILKMNDSTYKADDMCQSVIDVFDKDESLDKKFNTLKNTIICDIDTALYKADICPNCGGTIVRKYRNDCISGPEVIKEYCQDCGCSFEEM